jgi:hypothetical protein
MAQYLAVRAAAVRWYVHVHGLQDLWCHFCHCWGVGWVILGEPVALGADLRSTTASVQGRQAEGAVVPANLVFSWVKTKYAQMYLLGPQPAAMPPVVQGHLDLHCICACCMIQVLHTTQVVMPLPACQ